MTSSIVDDIYLNYILIDNNYIITNISSNISLAVSEGQGGFCGMQMNDDLYQIVCITFMGVSILNHVLKGLLCCHILVICQIVL